MDADHLSQEWDNAPMPHTMFFDMHGHAIHGFFDVKHLGLAVSHGCVRLSPDQCRDAVRPGENRRHGQHERHRRRPDTSGGEAGHGAASSRQRKWTSAAASGRCQIAPDDGQPQPTATGQPMMGSSGTQPYYGQPALRPAHLAQPAYGQRYYGGQTYYAQPYGQPYYGQPAYRQW